MTNRWRWGYDSPALDWFATHKPAGSDIKNFQPPELDTPAAFHFWGRDSHAAAKLSKSQEIGGWIPIVWLTPQVFV